MLQEITPLILTFNEAPNLRRTLKPLAWATEIVVVDSFSTDSTVEIANSVPSVRLIQRQFDEHCAQWNFGVAQCRTPWVLALDADHVITDAFVQQLSALQPGHDVAAFLAPFTYCICGRPLRGSLYPPRAVLFRPECCLYEQDGHTQKLRVTGATRYLNAAILHDDRKPLSRWFWAQQKYAELEVLKLLSTPKSQLRVQDRLRRCIIPAPFLVFFYTLLAKGVILDGWPGWYYAFQRTLAEIILSLQLIEVKLGRSRQSEPQTSAVSCSNPSKPIAPANELTTPTPSAVIPM